MRVPGNEIAELTRRDFLVNASRGVGGLAFASLLQADGLLAGEPGGAAVPGSPPAVKPPHTVPRAKQHRLSGRDQYPATVLAGDVLQRLKPARHRHFVSASGRRDVEHET